MPTNRSKPNNLVQTIERVALIFDILGMAPNGISVGELSEKTGFPKGTSHRLLSSLAYFDYVRQDPETKNYQLGFKIVELGNRLLGQLDFRAVARPELIHLAEQTKETVHMVILDRNEALYVDKVDSSEHRSGLRMVSMLGSRLPAHCSAVGKVLLAHLSERALEDVVREKGLPKRTRNTITDIGKLRTHLTKVLARGFAFDNEENEIGIRCVAAPIRNESGQVIAAISISVPTLRIQKSKLQTTLKDRIVETAMNISHKLGYRDFDKSSINEGLR